MIANQSDFQRDVEAIVQRMLPDIQKEVMLGERGGHYIVDMVSAIAGVAIEVDGPWHYNRHVPRGVSCRHSPCRSLAVP